jgi:predicted RNA binding protein YcfA (HicA-like mRNA interferase family)
MSVKYRPLKMKEAIKLISQTGATISSGGKHLKVKHSSQERTFTLPRGGSSKRPTLSPGMSFELIKYLEECKQIK